MSLIRLAEAVKVMSVMLTIMPSKVILFAGVSIFAGSHGRPSSRMRFFQDARKRCPPCLVFVTAQ